MIFQIVVYAVLGYVLVAFVRTITSFKPCGVPVIYWPLNLLFTNKPAPERTINTTKDKSPTDEELERIMCIQVKEKLGKVLEEAEEQHRFTPY